MGGSWSKVAHGIQDGMGLRRFARSFPLLRTRKSIPNFVRPCLSAGVSLRSRHCFRCFDGQACGLPCGGQDAVERLNIIDS